MMDRRAFMGAAAAATVSMPFAAVADGANSPATAARARAIYGSRIARLSAASPDAILAEKNAFTLFTTGAYRNVVKDKEIMKTLKGLSKTALAAAGKGDASGAQAAVKE